MGKSKKKQKDFQKVKLKVGRKLPKGLNVTDTSFKTKKIVLRDQLSRPVSGEPTTTRKLSIQDLIARLHHYNAPSRLDALMGLKELGSNHPEMFAMHLRALLEILGTLCSDKESTVRQAAQKVLRLLLNSVATEKLSAFGPLLLSHLGCAVNHLSPSVRHDALDLLGVFLDCVPSLVVRTPYGTLRNFLNMISASAETSHPASRRRVLCSQPGSRHCTNRATWVRVLSHLERFLRAGVVKWFPAAPSSATSGGESSVCHVGTTAEMPLFKRGLFPQSHAAFGLYAGLLCAEAADSGSRNSSRDFAEELVPLLLDMWVEADPTSASGETTGRESLVLMDRILKVLLLLTEWLRKENAANVRWLEETFGRQLMSHFRSRFPCSQDCYSGLASGVKKHKGDRFSERQVSVTSINLGICEVLAGLPGVLTSEQSLKVLCFFEELLSSGQVRSADVHVVVKVAQLLLPCVSPTDSLRLAEAMFSLYVGSEALRPKDCYLVLNFFYGLLLEPVSILDAVRPVVRAFLRTLPERALDVQGPLCNSQGLCYLGKVAQLRLPDFLGGLQECSLTCIDLLPKLAKEEQQRTVVELICRIPELESSHFEALFAAVMVPLPRRTLLYLLHLLLARLQDEKNNASYIAAYSSFLLNILIGMSRKKHSALKRVWADDSSWLELKELVPELSHLPVVPADAGELVEHFPVVDVVVRSLLAFPVDWDLNRILEPFMDQLLEAYGLLPCCAALSLVHLAGHRGVMVGLSLGAVCVGLAATLLCIAVQLLSSKNAAVDVILEVIVGYVMRCPNGLLDLLNQLLPALRLPISSPCLQLVCGSIGLLARSGLLETQERALITNVLCAAKEENPGLQHYIWYSNMVEELCKGATGKTAGSAAVQH